MPANFETGFSVREVPWHGLGIVRDSYPGRAAAMIDAGHTWSVEEGPIKFGIPSRQVPGTLRAVEAPEYKALYRSDNESLLSVVGQDYQVLQNDTLWDLAESFFTVEDSVKYETAGVLDAGRKTWVLVKINGDYLAVPGDDSPTSDYLFLCTSHDGSVALQARETAVRVVCQNTYSLALGSGRGMLKFRHTASAPARIDQARRALSKLRQDRLRTAAKLAHMGTLVLSPDAITWALEEFRPMPADPTDRVANNVNEARAAIRAILAGPTIPDAHRETAYGVFNALIEYTDHVTKARSAENRFARTMLGNQEEKSRAAELVLAAAR